MLIVYTTFVLQQLHENRVEICAVTNKLTQNTNRMLFHFVVMM